MIALFGMMIAIIILNILFFCYQWWKFKDVLLIHPVQAVMLHSERKTENSVWNDVNASYIYEVDGELFSDQIVGFKHPDKYEFIAEHPADAEITIYISREHPEFNMRGLSTRWRLATRILIPLLPKLICVLVLTVLLMMNMTPSDFSF